MLALKVKVSITEGYTMNALSVASYFVELANNTPENDLTNLKLQKLLYYTQGKYLAQTGEPAFNDKIEAWKYGPVVPDVYHAFKSCGSFPVTVFDINYDTSPLADDLRAFTEKLWVNLGEVYSGSHLVQTTHAAGTPWSKYYKEEQRNIEIPLGELKTYFTSNDL